MMKKQFVISVLCVLISTFGISQNGIFQNLDSHSKDDLFKEFYSISKSNKKEGGYTIAGPRYDFTVERKKLDTGENTGFLFYTEEGQMNRYYATNAVTRNDSLIGYPNTYMIYDTKEKKGKVMIDDFIFILEGVNLKDLSYKGIDVLLVREGYGAKDKEESKDGEKKESKFKGKLKKLKGKLNDSVGGGSMGLMIKIQKLNLDKMISDYLSAEREYEKNYKRSAKEEQEWQRIISSKQKYRKDIETERNEYWASPAGQATKANYGNSGSTRCEYTVKNSSFKRVYYQTSKGSVLTLTPGQTITRSCNDPIYYDNNGTRGSLIAGGSDSYKGKTVVLD